MTPLGVLLALVVQDPPAAAPPRPPPPVAADEDFWPEEKVLAKKGIPQPPPDMDRKAYQTWKRSLPAKVQRTIAAHCKAEGGKHQEVCNGIGPLGIPSPPLLDLESDDPDAGRKEWMRSLTAPQRHYVASFCHFDENDPRTINNAYTELCGGTPIVIAFHGERVQFSAGGTSVGRPAAPVTTPWLARDIDGDGRITSDELFGSSTKLPDGSRAKHGFQALAALDSNHDGVLDDQDVAFASLVVWADRDGDRASAPDELSPAAKLVKSMSLAIDKVERCDARGNCEGERAPMQWQDETGAARTGELIDVYLRYR